MPDWELSRKRRQTLPRAYFDFYRRHFHGRKRAQNLVQHFHDDERPFRCREIFERGARLDY